MEVRISQSISESPLEFEITRVDCNSLWGPVDIDRFASFKNEEVNRFNSRYWNPGTEAVNAFSQDWSHDINLLVPPTNLVARCLKQVLQCKARGILVSPAWQSASFWPILFPGK